MNHIGVITHCATSRDGWVEVQPIDFQAPRMEIHEAPMPEVGISLFGFLSEMLGGWASKIITI